MPEFATISNIITELKSIKDLLLMEGVNSKAAVRKMVENLITKLEQKMGE